MFDIVQAEVDETVELTVYAATIAAAILQSTGRSVDAASYLA